MMYMHGISGCDDCHQAKYLVGIIVKAEVGEQFLKPALFLAGFCSRDKQLKASMQKSLWGKLLTGQESGSKLMGL